MIFVRFSYFHFCVVLWYVKCAFMWLITEHFHLIYIRILQEIYSIVFICILLGDELDARILYSFFFSLLISCHFISVAYTSFRFICMRIQIAVVGILLVKFFSKRVRHMAIGIQSIG